MATGSPEGPHSSEWDHATILLLLHLMDTVEARWEAIWVWSPSSNRHIDSCLPANCRPFAADKAVHCGFRVSRIAHVRRALHNNFSMMKTWTISDTLKKVICVYPAPTYADRRAHIQQICKASSSFHGSEFPSLLVLTCLTTIGKTLASHRLVIHKIKT